MSTASKIYIEGNTYPVKEALKAIGCRWDKDRRAWYAETQDVAEKAKAIVQPHPLYNSPPPQDLGTADPVELAAKFGRKAIEGAKVLSFTGYGKPAEANGRIVHSKKKGVRYVQVAHGSPRYYSRDMLEDFDMFNDEPGYQYQWDGVPVEPTEEERAADQAEADAAAAKDRARATLKDITELVRTTGEFPQAAPGERLTTSEGRGTETICAEKEGVYSGARSRFVIGKKWIWHTRYNGSDGDDWIYNNLRVPFDADLAARIRDAASLLGYNREIEPGEPARREIKTASGSVYGYGYKSSETWITWRPADPIGGHSELTGGTAETEKGEAVVVFQQTIGKGKGKKRICARLEGRPDLRELVALAKELSAELAEHYQGFETEEDN